MLFDGFRTFLHSDSGAVTVDWVLVSAAVTGLGLSSAVAVRTGSGSLAGDINQALSGAQVAGACGQVSYAMNTMSDQTAESSRAHAQGYSDENLIAEFSNATSKVADYYEAEGTSSNTGEVMDYLHILNEEMSSRRLSPASGVASFNQTHETVYGSNLSGACGSDGSGGGGGSAQTDTYQPLIISEADAIEIAQNFAIFSTAELELYLSGLDAEVGASITNRDVAGAQKALDHMQYLVAEITSRDDSSELAVKSAQIYDAALQEYGRMAI